jgi:GntR family transcriptional regulator
VADPMWRQIAEDLRMKIESGELGRDGEPLPTELELQVAYRASRNTVRDAVKWLVTRNLVYTRSGQGTFVQPKVDPFVTRDNGQPESGKEESTAFDIAVRDRCRAPRVSSPRVESLRAEGRYARELHIADDESVVSRHQQRFIDDVPYSLQTTFYPLTFVERGAVRLIRAENIPEGAVKYIENILGIKQVGWTDRYTVRQPDAVEATFFSLPDDGRVPVVELTRTGYDQDGVPLRVTITTFPSDRNEFVMQYGQVPEDEWADEAVQPTSPSDRTGE